MVKPIVVVTCGAPRSIGWEVIVEHDWYYMVFNH